MSGSPKSTSKVPVYVFDEHNEAFHFWHRAQRQGHIPEPTDLVHVDAHSDLDVIDELRASLYFTGTDETEHEEHFSRLARESLSISDYLRPAVLSGIIKNMYIVFPTWKRPYSRRKVKRTSIASAFGEGLVLKHGLRVTPTTRKFFPDIKGFSYTKCNSQHLPKRRKILLDIDMDYFACRETVQNSHRFEFEITPQQFARREAVLADSRLPFTVFSFSFTEREGSHYLVVEHKKFPDRAYLPTFGKIEEEMDELFDQLEANALRPCVITISRSINSGYCPANYAEKIEALLSARIETFLK